MLCICSLTSFLKTWLMNIILVRRTTLSSGDQEILCLFKTFVSQFSKRGYLGEGEATQQW